MQGANKTFCGGYAEAVRFLYELQWFGLKLGLENTHRLAALAGDPQKRLRFIHVAGTNGKGSTCAMLESMCRAAGLRVGLFTSPHLVSFSERLQVNRTPIAAAEVVRLVREMRGLLGHFEPPGAPTFFEVVTVMALRYFADQNCDLVIWETGLGGRLDATNIVSPLASVITNIQFDHERWLGYTLASIAAEKAGIIKPGTPVLTATDQPEALTVIRETAARLAAPLLEVRPADAPEALPAGLRLPLLGAHQRLNAALAVATLRVLARQLPVSGSAIRRGLETLQWPGRLQRIQNPAGPLDVLDGAHNPAGAAALRAALAETFPGVRPTLLLGILQDKDWQAMCRVLAPIAQAVYLTPVASPRAAAPEALRSACAEAQPGACLVVCGSLAEALRLSSEHPFRVITGSLYLVGEALELLGGAAPRAHSERDLNEWHEPALAVAGRG